jgi:hypothetical protein
MGIQRTADLHECASQTPMGGENRTPAQRACQHEVPQRNISRGTAFGILLTGLSGPAPVNTRHALTGGGSVLTVPPRWPSKANEEQA